jgi:hypothetical protein
MDVHRAALDDVKSRGYVAFMKEVIALFQRFDHRDFGNFFQVRLRQPGEKLTVSQ